MHKQPVFKKLDHINTNLSLPVSEHLYDFGFYIPSGLALTQEQQDKVRIYIQSSIVPEMKVRYDFSNKSSS